MQGNAAYASGEGKGQASIWGKYITPYAIFKTYAVFNSEVAKREGNFVTDEDLDAFTHALIYSLVNYRSTSKNQMPRVLVEVIYRTHNVDGELDYVDVSYNCADTDLRDISQVKLDFTRLNNYYELKKDVIEEIRCYIHKSVNVDDIPASFNVFSI
jgi:CRISPR-associated protein Csh2